MSGISKICSTKAQQALAELLDSDGNIVIVSGGLTSGMYSSELADDAEITLPTGKAGWGFVQFGDNEQYGDFTFSSAGVVTLGNVSASFVNTDTDGNACVYDAGSGIAIKNRLGSSKTIRYNINYS